MGCNVQDIVSWYQKKIGTYDKQQWEKTVEQRILSGLTHVSMKSAKLKTELIDVDLVRGSAFTKAKPKHGFFTVTRLAALRLFFMPFYFQWWICQTSGRIFIALIVLYFLQLFNSFLYFCTWFPLDTFSTLDNIPPSEVLVPFAMMFVLSVIHSQIVSTHSTNGRNKKPEPQNNTYMRRIKRTRRRITSVSKIRQMHPDLKTHAENTFESSSLLNDNTKFNKRPRIKICTEEPLIKHGRSVVWDTTPVKNNSKYCKFLNREDSGVALTEEPKSKSCLNCSGERGSSDSILVLESEDQQLTPSLDDDGFESLDGNGSCDSNKEEQDISLTAEEYESVLKSSPTHRDLKEIGLIIHKCSLKLTKPSDAHSLSDSPVHGKYLDSGEGSSHVNFYEEKDDDKNHKEVVEAETDIDDSESEHASLTSMSNKRLLTRRKGSQQNLSVSIKNLAESSYNSSGDESEDGTTLSTPGSFCPLTEGTTSAGEWVGVTTNSEECSYSSEIDGSDNQFAVMSDMNEHPFAWEMEMVPNVIMSPSCAPVGKVSCTMWEKKDVKKANLSVLDISSAIIARVEAMPENVDYFYIGVLMSVALATVPCISRLTDSLYDPSNKTGSAYFAASVSKNFVEPFCPVRTTPSILMYIRMGAQIAFGSSFREYAIISIAMFERFCLSAIFFFLLTVAERTFKQRFLYAKFFSHLTSFRRAKKSELPHFRLNKVRNIKSWLSVRSYLKKRGPQRSVDVIVSTAFLITVILLSFLSVELLKDSEYNVEAVGWCVVIGFYMLRFMTLGTKINRKYRNLSTLITEQINLYLQIEQKPNKKEELMVANSVLKLAADLLKELESPFKISGFSANPYLYTVTKVVMLSALSGILSEFLGFKLKLNKIKIK